MNGLITDWLNPSTTMGVHGTSLEQVVKALKKGKFEQEVFSRKEDPIRCDSIHFIANMECFGDYFSNLGVTGMENKDFKKMLEAAKVWARDIGFRHYLAVNTNDTKPLGWHVVMWEMDKWFEQMKGLLRSDVSWEFPYETIVERIQPGGGTYGIDILGHIEKQGISRERLYQLLVEGFDRRGCIVGLNEKCRELKIERGDLDYDPEAQLYVPKGGLSLDYINGIVPLGEVERRMLLNTKYYRCMRKGEPEVISLEGVAHLKIYRGLAVPERETVSEGDNKNRIPEIIDLMHPGMDWTPIKAFADVYSSGVRRVILSAYVPLNDQKILEESIKNSDLHPDDWFTDGESNIYEPRLEKLTDCLIVVVPEDRYHLLKDLKIEESEGRFSVTPPRQ